MASIPRSIHSRKRLALTALFPLVLFLFLPTTASAHVKWFASYNETTRPLPIQQVASAAFFEIFAFFLIILGLIFVADSWVAKRWPSLKSAGSSFVGTHEKWVRLGTAAFLLCTWAIGLNILTPELHTNTAWIFSIQFLSAFCLAWRRTCVLSAIGLCLLYVYGIDKYGFFHMLDYVYFLGLAVFIAGVTLPQLARIRVSAMTACLAFSIMWTAIEKLLYPQWTRQVLEQHTHMAMGIPFGFFIVFAAFAEFTLAFYLAVGRGMLRVGTLVLILVFISAMPEFGRRDIVGHLPLVAILGVPLMGGNSALQRFWRLPGRGALPNAAMACLLYTVSLAIFLGAYYGVQRLEY
jgi:hypothetical protein